MRVAVAGFQHETNTFSNVTTTYNDFLEADSWPQMLCQQEIIDVMPSKAIPIGGFVDEAVADQAELLPVLWCSATPSGLVLKSACEELFAKIFALFASLEAVDAIYLDLHGAMVAEHLQDTEGEFLRQLRGMFPDVPIVISVDFHANITENMIKYTDQIVGYRTYPHVDMYDVGRKSYKILKSIVTRSRVACKKYKKIPFLVPMTAQSTLVEPCREIYDKIAAYEQEYDVCVEFIMGFPLSDIVDVGPAVIVYGDSSDRVGVALDYWYKYLVGCREKFNVRYYSEQEAVDVALVASIASPVLLVDTQDNSGCGGSSDTTGLLREMISQRLPESILGLLCDPGAAIQAHEAGIGSCVDLQLGAAKSRELCEPIGGSYRVLALSNGCFIARGAFYRNIAMDLGLMAVLEIDGVQVVVSSKKAQAADREMFHHLGIDLSKYRAIGLKSSVHYQADFASLLAKNVIVISPGYNTADLTTLQYRNKPENVLCI